MSGQATQTDGQPSDWDAGELAQRLGARLQPGGVVHLQGLSYGALERRVGELRTEINHQEAELLVLDPTGGLGDGTTFREVVSEYVRRCEQREGLSEDARRMAEFLSLARSRTTRDPHDEVVEGQLYQTTICRIWKVLSQTCPAVLLVVNPSECSPTERGVLEHFVADFFDDPIGELMPELEDVDRVRSVIALVGEVGESVPLDIDSDPIETIDLSGGARSSVRNYLASDTVVEKFVASTGGDPERMEALMESLPSDCTNFWHYRYQRLEAPLQKMLEVLAVGGSAVPVEVLEDAWEQVGSGGYFSRTVRDLTERGFVRRNIGSGCVTLQLDDPEFGRAVKESLDAGAAAEIHGALADAGRRTHRGDVDDHFVARHYLEAGERERGFEFGRRAAARLHSEHALEEARDLFERILPHAPTEADREEIHRYLLDVYAGLGDVERALGHCEELDKCVEAAEERDGLACQRGRLQVKAGEYDKALDAFRSVRERRSGEDEADRELWLRATVGAGEAYYASGDHAEAERLAREAIEALDVAEDGETGRAGADRALVRARNLLVKVAILRSNGGDARSMIEANRSLARTWGWDSELDRAEANLALVRLQEGEHRCAIDLLEEVCDRSPRPDSVPRSTLLLNLGMCLQRKGALEDALIRYRQALRSARQTGDEHAYGLAAYNLGTLYQDIGAYDRVESIVEHLRSRQVDQHRHLFIGTLPNVLRANVLIEREEFARALEVLGELSDSDPSAAARSPAELARLRGVFAHVALAQVDAARRLLEDSEVEGSRLDSEKVQALRQAGRAAAAGAREDYEEAESLGRQSAETLREVGHFQDALRATAVRVEALRELGRDSEARSVAEHWLNALQERADRVPEFHRDDFFAVPLYHRLVRLTQRLNGEVPAPFERAVSVEDAAAEDENGASDADTQTEQDWRATASFRQWRSRYSDIVGQDERLLKVFKRIDQVADSESPVLIQGESGTGKELIAEAIHRHGFEDPQDNPFVKVNCGAFVDNLLLSELFGHEKGAFTGAVDEKVGRFERADGGTIFLDEIGEISPKAQVALLRVLQEGEFERVGGTETQKVDVRVICATNRDLEKMVESGEFRLDLYYRLKGVVLELPPLRERRADIPRLVRHFAREYAEGEPKEFSRDVLEFLASYNWPGNIRELQNFVRSVLLFASEDAVEMDHVREFGDFFAEGEVDLEAPDIDYDVELEDWDDQETPEADVVGDPEEALIEEIVADGLSLAKLKKRIEHQSIRRALMETGGNITRAAEILKMTRPRLSQIVNGDEKLVELKERLVS